MSRLVDYFVIVGFDHEKERGGLSNGVILQRFPEINWEDTPFHEGIEWFCQPQGWALSTQRQEPRFYVSVLTDVDANRHYCACLCFNETVAITPTKPADEDEESLESNRPVANITHHSIMYAPKCLVIVSRQDYIDTFRNCLGIIYTVFIENLGVPLETLVGNLVGCVVVPAPGGGAVRFSLGAGDRQALQPPAAPPAPTTQTAAYTMLRLLGIHNSVTLWCAVMSEHKVLLVSLAASRLMAVCRALAALMFPFRYAHVYIPLLPAGLVEVLATPTPFLCGVHSSLKEDVADLLDVIVADLDVGSLHIPPGINVPRPEGKLLSSLQDSLALILQPELRSAEMAFAPPAPPSSPPHMLDKEIRAVFMRTLANLLHGYRHCLQIIRIHPSPVQTFHKAGFLGSRGLAQCPFAMRLLDSMYFNGFVAERGPPWRPMDLWDELLQNLPEQLRLESLNPELELQHIQELAMQLHLNENPNPQPFQQRILRPPEGASTRIHQPPFPTLDNIKVAQIIQEATQRNASQNKISGLRPPPPRIVPPGAPPTGATELDKLLLTNSARRLEVLHACVAAIFECRYADARKSFPAVLRALKAEAARRALVSDLANRLPSNKHLLHHHQFELIVRLMNCALQSTTDLDEHSLAAAMLPLATAYCRKLCTGVIQYAYMCIQEHQVWSTQQFWEAAFYQEVQRDIKALYLSTPNHHPRVPSPREDEDYISLLKAQEPSALEIAAEQMRLWPSVPPEKQRELIASEESTLYSQAIHYANRMVYLLLPLETAGRRMEPVRDDDRNTNSVTNSVAESDSADAESGFEEADPGEVGANVIRMVSRFVDKVCTEGGVTAEHVRCLHQMIPGLLHIHAETLDAVARESRRLPPVHKPRITAPALIPGETILSQALRAYMICDGRFTPRFLTNYPRITAPALIPGETLLSQALRAYMICDGRFTPLLPAEGALFLTNYRLIFRGTPHDQYACEQTVVRSFPIWSLTREKQIRAHYVPQLEQSPQEGLQLRSATFQLIKVVLDEEVSGEQLESFKKQLARLRHPADAAAYLALAPRAPPAAPPAASKQRTLRGFAKKTLLNTARKAGLKPKQSKRQKYVLPSAGARSLTSPPLMSSLSADTLSLEELDIGDSEPTEPLAARTLERVRERIYAREWARLGLATSPFKLTHANALYTLCRSYPAVIPVPESVSDESLRRVSRCYRQARLPVITWKHPRTQALLVRSSVAHHKGVMGMLKSSSHQQNAAQPQHEPTSSVEQERYLSTLVACSPTSRADFDLSSLSLESLLLCEDNMQQLSNRHLSMLGRSSGGKSGIGGSRHFGSLKEKKNHDLRDCDDVSDSGRRAPVYLICDKGVGGAVAGVEPVPVEYPDVRATKHAMKKLLRALAPSAPDPQPLLRLIEESGWLQQLKQLFQLSGAVVDLLDLQAASVLLSLEDGGDVTCQISSLAQICLEPYYRTLEGFRILIEKEWLALGHKFQTRNNVGPTPQQGFTPTFLMFLDAVHQLLNQFPLAFEFNDYFLRFIAYHSVSCRFRTFLLDSEAQRVERGLTDDRRPDPSRLVVETGGAEDDSYGLPGSARAPACGLSLFDYIDKMHQRSPAFYNFLYTPDLDNPVLRPVSSLASLEIWQYYTSEQLSHGAPYDVEVLSALDNTETSVVTNGYDCISRCMPDAFTGLLERIRQLELELGHLPQKWKVRWDQLELPNTLELQRSASLRVSAVRALSTAAHRRNTRGLLARGRQAAAPPAPAHRWQPAPAAAPARCDTCAELLWPPLQTGVRCAECSALCHERCAGALPPPCGKRPPPDQRHLPPPGNALQASSQQYYEQFSSNVAENRTHEGHLYKRGALLKGWKQRWFVLDSIKHQLRYYDAMEDSHCKGFIDLAEVIAVSQAAPAPGPPKKCDDRSFFDLRTSRRTYNFCASDANAAQEWTEKLQACLQ